MITLTLDIQDPVSVWLSKMGSDLQGGRDTIHQMMGNRAEAMTRDYLMTQAEVRHGTADDLGATPTGHLERAVETVRNTADAQGATVQITSPGLSRAFRALTITPKGGRKYLTIPATAEAYGKRAGQFADLRLQFFGRGLLGLVKAEQSSLAGRKRSGYDTEKAAATPDAQGKRRGTVYYWLKKSVSIPQDRTLLPSDGLYHEAATEGVRDWLIALAQVV